MPSPHLARSRALSVPSVLAGALVAGLAAASPAPAQSAGRGPLLLELPASTTALAMGNAFPLGGPSAEALFYNPALLATARDVGVSIQRYGSGATLLTASGAGEWFGEGIGVGVLALDYGAASGAPADATGDAGILPADGPVGGTELVAAVGWGADFGGFEAGVAGKVVEQRLGGGRDATVAFDLGAAADVGPVAVGAAVQHLGPDLDAPGGRLSLPDRVTVGAAFEGWWVGPLDLGASVAVSRQADEEWIPGGGVEVAYWPVRGRTFIARAGLRRVPRGPAGELTLGAAFEGDVIAVEYAWRPFDGDLDDAHRLGLRWRR